MLLWDGCCGGGRDVVVFAAFDEAFVAIVAVPAGWVNKTENTGYFERDEFERTFQRRMFVVV